MRTYAFLTNLVLIHGFPLRKEKSRSINQNKRTELYFGYGANLSVDRFLNRKMNVKELGNAILSNHEIRFSLSNEYKGKGYAGVDKAENKEVWGVLYEIDSLSLRLLDSLEWCGFGAYDRKLVKVKLENGEEYECYCYFVKYPKKNLKPSKIYLNNILKAAKERRFPDSYVNFIRSHEAEEKFEIDYGFSLLFYSKRRFFEKELLPVYRIHDKLREKLCDLI